MNDLLTLVWAQPWASSLPKFLYNLFANNTMYSNFIYLSPQKNGHQKTWKAQKLHQFPVSNDNIAVKFYF